MTVDEGEDAQLECSAAVQTTAMNQLCDNSSEIEWLKNNLTIVGCLKTRENPYSLNTTSGVLTIANVSMLLNDLTFTCRVASPNGLHQSNSTLIVFPSKY